MKFSFFEAFTEKEAADYLNEFLAFGKHRGMEILSDNLHFTIDLDFTIESISSVFKALLPAMNAFPREPDLDVPKFIRDTDVYKKGLFDFDDRSNSIVLACAYYLGESFVKNFKQLSWGIGNTDFAQGNMPVVVGFKFNMEMPPILVAENILSGVISGINDENSIDTAIETWSSKYL